MYAVQDEIDPPGSAIESHGRRSSATRIEKSDRFLKRSTLQNPDLAGEWGAGVESGHKTAKVERDGIGIPPKT